MELVGTLGEHYRSAHSYSFAVVNYALANEVLHSPAGYSQHIQVIGYLTFTICHSILASNTNGTGW